MTRQNGYFDIRKTDGSLVSANHQYCKILQHKNREELKALIESLGGKATGSVTSKTDYLINNDINSMSGKNKKAKSLGIPIISEEDFIQMLQ